MKRVFQYMLSIVMLALLMGCSSEFKPDTLSENDLCIVKEDDSKSKVCFGMERSEAEEILGQATKNIMMRYDYGVSVVYREDTVAYITLDEKSKDIYKTVRGVQVGDDKENVLKLYGEKYPIMRTTSPETVDYVYDNVKGNFVGEQSWEETDPSAFKDQLFVSTYIVDGKVSKIFLADREALITLR